MNSTIKIFIFRQYVRCSIFTGFVLMAQYDSNFLNKQIDVKTCFQQCSLHSSPHTLLCCHGAWLCALGSLASTPPGMPGTHPAKFCLEDVNGNIPQYYHVLSDIADQYWLPSVRSASSRFHSAIRRHQSASVRQADSRLTRLDPTNLELALTSPLPGVQAVRRAVGTHMRHRCWDVLWHSHSCIVTDA